MKNHLLLANSALGANATVASPLNQNAPLNQSAQGLFGFNKMALFDYDLDDMIEYAALSSLFANNNAANAGVANNPPFGNQLFANNGANIFSQISALYNADISQLQTNSAQSPLNQNAQGLFGFNKMALFDYDLDDMIENAALSSLFANAGAANAGVANNQPFGNQLFANNGTNIFSQISALYNADFSQLQTNSAQSPLNQNAQGLFGFNKMALFDYDDMMEYAAFNSLFANNGANNANTQLFSPNALNNAFMMEAYEDFYDDMKDYYKIGLLNQQIAQGGMQGLFL